MTILKYCNIVLLVLLLLGGILIPLSPLFQLLFYTVLLLLGAFQASTGLVLFVIYPKYVAFQLYVGGLSLFAVLCFFPWVWKIIVLPLVLYYTFITHINHQYLR